MSTSRRRLITLYSAVFLAEACYLLLVFTTGDMAHLAVSLLFLIGVLMLLGQRGEVQDLCSNSSEKTLGLLVLILCLAGNFWLMTRGLDTTEKHPLRLIPVGLFLGSSIFFKGFGALRAYRDELVVLFFLGGPHVFLWWMNAPDFLAWISAHSSAYLLWYLGIDAVVQDHIIAIAGRAVSISPECAGLDTITYLMGLAVLTYKLYPRLNTTLLQSLLVAVVSAYVVNNVRIAFLAVLNIDPSDGAFGYWHTSTGAQLFGVLAMVLFWGWYFFPLVWRRLCQEKSP